VAKQAVLNFFRPATSQVPPEYRIATFDQDGTLWVQHPVHTQAMFALDRLHTLAPQHSDWRNREPKRLYTAFVYQPMLEVMNYLRANGSKTYIVTGGGLA
jgi:hypothetical protein